MPFENRGITATSVEQYQKCQQYLERLNSLVETNQKIPVRIAPFLLGQGIVVIPESGKIRIIHVNPAPDAIFSIEFNVEKKEIAIRAQSGEMYVIKMEAIS